MPYFLATAAVESWLPPTSEVTSTPGIRLSASRCFWPKAPWPATQIFMMTSYCAVGDYLSPVSPGLVPAIHAFLRSKQGVDGRDKPGHDEHAVLASNTINF